MKTFLDLQATDSSIKVELELFPIFDLYAPTVEVTINEEVLFSGILTTSIVVSRSILLTDSVCVEIQIRDKKYSTEHETALEIRSINIDGVNVVPRYINQSVYENDHEYNRPTNYLGFNGCWKLDITKPFYQWLHDITGQGWLLHP